LRYASTFGIDLNALDAPWGDRKLNICIRSFESLPAAARLLIGHLQPFERPADEDAARFRTDLTRQAS
jgi:hypothetical protein